MSDTLELRKWCVEAALKMQSDTVVENAEKILNFLQSGCSSDNQAFLVSPEEIVVVTAEKSPSASVDGGKPAGREDRSYVSYVEDVLGYASSKLLEPIISKRAKLPNLQEQCLIALINCWESCLKDIGLSMIAERVHRDAAGIRDSMIALVSKGYARKVHKDKGWGHYEPILNASGENYTGVRPEVIGGVMRIPARVGEPTFKQSPSSRGRA